MPIHAPVLAHTCLRWLQHRLQTQGRRAQLRQPHVALWLSTVVRRRLSDELLQDFAQAREEEGGFPICPARQRGAEMFGALFGEMT